MNEIAKTELPVWAVALKNSEKRFDNVNDELLNFNKECGFAKQSVQNNDFLMKIATTAPHTLMDAIVNVAAVGLSLNSATQYAYLVPRDNKVCLDISYKGMIKIATDSGSIKWAQADIVYQNDDFDYRGVTEKPVHSANVFGDRGEMIGVYCVAKTVDGDYLTEIINKAQIDEIKSSAHGVNSQYSPWKRFPEEMWKKACIKRASKTWPKTQQHERLDRAIEVVNEHEGNDFKGYTDEQKELFDLLIEADDSLGLFLFIKLISQDEWIALYNTGEKGKKTALKSKCKAMEKQGYDSLYIIEESIGNDDQLSVVENVESMTDRGYNMLEDYLHEDQVEYIRTAKNEAA